MLNSKSSSVKLDFGTENDEEEEFEEEESEEASIQEMDDEGDEMDEDGFPINIEDDLVDLDNDKNDQDGNRVINIQTSEQNFGKYTEALNTREANVIRKNDTDKSYQYSKNQREINIRPDHGEKTVFTRLSEEIFKKFMSKKDNGYKKASSYDYFVDDRFLNRVVEKNDPTSAIKFGNFLNRNKEYVDKKVLRLNERVQNMTNEINSNCTGTPNGKIFTKEELRDPNQFMMDQTKYYETIGVQIEAQRQDVISLTNSKMRNVPEISKKSKAIVEKKLQEDNGKAVHDRLASEKLNKEKKHIYKTEAEKANKEGNNSNKGDKIQKKMTVEEMKSTVEKLHKDADERKIKKSQLLDDKDKLKEIYNIYNSDDELTTHKSTVLILEKFVQNYERALHNKFNQKDSIDVSFDEYSDLMKTLGFVLSDHIDVSNSENSRAFKVENNPNSSKEEIMLDNLQQGSSPKSIDTNVHSTNINKKMDKDKISKLKEFNLLKDSWKILTNGQEDILKVNSNQLLVFCASLLGVYKGETELPQETAEQKMNKTQVAEENGTEMLKKTFTKLNTSKQHKQAKKAKIPNRFSDYKELTKYNTINGETTRNKNKTFSVNSSAKPNEKNALKAVVPELDTSRYFYLHSTVKLIKELFITMYLNRANFIAGEKKKIKREKLEIAHHQYMPPVNKSHKQRRSADNFKRRVFEEYETMRIQNNSQSPNQSLYNNNTTYIKKNKLKMEDINKILKLKKEYEIAKFKEEQKKNEMKECTFQPNITSKKVNPKGVHEKINSLYIDGVHKLRSKNSIEVKEPEDLSMECTFHPKINDLKTKIFDVNPLLHDERIRREVEKLEKTRIEKKIIEYKKQRGINVLKNFNSADLANVEQPQWRFEMEKKTYKDPIEIAVNERGGSIKNKTISRRDFNKTLKLQNTMRGHREPLFNVEVNIDDNYRTEKLEIYADDDPSKLAQSFSRKYGLPDDKKEKLQFIIAEKLSEHLS